MSSVLLLDERIQPDGAHARTWAACDGQRVQLRDDSGAIGEIPIAVLDQVMRRYGCFALERGMPTASKWTKS